ncbi:uncharacterized protein LOC131241313 isoform X2 [Magnolia sinica]|uniref:uncharacterized protein LOC131241313 isoform X2 n=1 Tax=Magnolia sinica TaxID=86752 RepID=UPI002658131A|nr:uncharacterized protein LOC131241313 isoform X2 [Magnolia sinica]
MMSSCLLLPVSRAHFPSRNFQTSLFPLGRGTNCFGFNDNGRKKRLKRERSSWCWRGIVCGILPVDPWAPTIDSQSIASQLFAASLLPYLGFLYFITKSKTSPKLTLFGFYFLLAFVGATTKVHYGTSLSNVDWLHGGAESLLTLTNLFIVMGLREALRKVKNAKESPSKFDSDMKEEKQFLPRPPKKQKRKIYNLGWN